MDNAILEVVLGLILVYITLSLLVMKVQETVIGRWHRGRQKNLHSLIREAVGRDEQLKARIFKNPLIFALSEGGEPADERNGTPMPVRGPSAIPADLFARVLLIELYDDGKGGHPADRYSTPTAFMADKAPAVGVNSDSTRIWGTLRGLIAGREADWPAFEGAIAKWFKDVGDRSDGWYQRSSQAWSLRLAIVTALFLNVDTFFIARKLSEDPDLRRGFASIAERVNTLFPNGTPAVPGAPAVALTTATIERPETRASAKLVDAIGRLNEAYRDDNGVTTYNLDQMVFNGATQSSLGFCTGVDAQVEPTTTKKYLSNPQTWLLILPHVLTFIEQQQVSDGRPALEPRPEAPRKADKEKSQVSGKKTEQQLASAASRPKETMTVSGVKMEPLPSATSAPSSPTVAPASSGAASATSAGGSASATPASGAAIANGASGAAPASDASKSVSASQMAIDGKTENYKSAYRCLSRVSVWVRSAITASKDARVRTSMQEAAVALESSKSALLDLIDNQRPTLSLRKLFVADPDTFSECATSPSASIASIQTCATRAAVGQVRLPLGFFGSNLRQQFCKPVNPKAENYEASGAFGQTLCGDTLFAGNPRLGIEPMALNTAGAWTFVFWIFGCIVTGFFVALGAPFWFGLLNKVVNIRAVGNARDDADDKRRGQGDSPPPAPTGQKGPTDPKSGNAPFSLARNGFEEQLVPADIISVQRQLGVSPTGVLDGPTRTALSAYTRQNGLEVTDELSFVLYDSIVKRSPTGSAVTRPDGRIRAGEVNENVQPLAKSLMTKLGFPGRFPASETRVTDDLRALAILYRYKTESQKLPRDRAVVDQARNNRRALDELDPALVADILKVSAVADPALARDPVAPWLDWAVGELGQLENGKASKADSNKRIIEYLNAPPNQGNPFGDSTPWCGAFASWVISRHNAMPASGSAKVSDPPAGSLESGKWSGPGWGTAVGASAGNLGSARPGDVVTFKLDKSAIVNHVAFVLEVDLPAGLVWVIGGNQAAGTCVCVSRFTAAEVADIRRP